MQTPKTPEKKSGSRFPLIASALVIVILVVALFYYYSVSTGRISSLQSSIDSQQGVISGQSSTISVLQGAVTSQQSSISALNANISGDQHLIMILNGILASNNATISSDNMTVLSLSSELAGARAMVSNLTAIVSNLTATVNLQASVVLVNAQTVPINGTGSGPSPFLTFSPAHAGYLLIEVSGSTEQYFAESTFEPAANNPSSAVFETVTGLTSTSPGATYFIVPIVPGAGYTFALVSNTSSDGTAVLTATYFY